MLTVEHLSCTIENRRILSDVSFCVPAGSYLTVIGPNGVGKTTLLRCIDGIIQNWTGEIQLDGESVRTISRRQLARRVAYIQQTNTSPPFSVREYVRLARYPYLHRFSSFSKRDEDLVEQAMVRMEVVRFADRALSTLSGGERQKVFLAAALAQEPQVLLLDEPTSFLDCRQQEETGRLLGNLHREEGVTVIEVTHDLNHAAIHGDLMLAFRDGRIAFFGSPAEMMTPEVLQSIYQTQVCLVSHPETGIKMIVPVAVPKKL